MLIKFWNRNRSNILLLAALLAYNSLFFAERFGLNLLLFFILILSFQFLLFQESFRNPRVLISAGLSLFLAIMVVWHNSALSKWMFFISYAITLGFILQPSIRMIGYSFLTAMSNFGKLPFEFFSWNRDEERNPKRRKVSKTITLALIPLTVGLLFFIIYRVANPIFAELTNSFWKTIEDWFTELFKHISFARIMFLLLGLGIISGLLIHRGYQLFQREDAQFANDIVRTRKRTLFGYISMDFKYEVISSLILLVLMNIMLFVLNYIDLKYVWINFKIPEGVSLKEMVHEGTEWLIVSIVLSMIVVIYVFRANQNFYSKNKWVKLLAMAWMIQNMFLAISLCIRNNQYVNWHAMAYKRLGVYVFIALVFIGLITMIIKIQQKKSLYYLLRINFWSAYLIMSLTCVVNWDIYIAQYNVSFANGSQLDTDFYLKLSPKAYPIVYENLDKIQAQIDSHIPGTFDYLYFHNIEDFKRSLDYNRIAYLAENEKYSWASFSRADAAAINYLKLIPAINE